MLSILALALTLILSEATAHPATSPAARSETSTSSTTSIISDGIAGAEEYLGVPEGRLDCRYIVCIEFSEESCCFFPEGSGRVLKITSGHKNADEIACALNLEKFSDKKGLRISILNTEATEKVDPSRTIASSLITIVNAGNLSAFGGDSDRFCTACDLLNKWLCSEENNSGEAPLAIALSVLTEHSAVKAEIGRSSENPLRPIVIITPMESK